ncbi:MAG: MarR family transcriptional regulator [Tenuifilaceae bacterium]|jgi:DNA-binding MarR family transcriptional regulator|nr:MarR family transcriptional regulator [Tenuifilaceae bacterium]
MAHDQLKLSNQICFPVYATSRLITREYQPHLDELGITYPQYIALMVLWETDEISVNEITQKLILNTNTVTPLLKRMETQGLITRKRSSTDERKVIVKLTEKGKMLESKAAEIPQKLIERLADSKMTVNELIRLKESLYQIINFLQSK